MTGHAAFFMGSDKVRYFLFINGKWRWRPTRVMRKAGFQLVNMGRGEIRDGKPAPSPEDQAKALRLNEDWDRHRMGLPARGVMQNSYPQGSLGEAFERVMRLREAEQHAKGVVLTREQRSRDDWPRAWKQLVKLDLVECEPRTITPEMMLAVRTFVTAEVSATEAHRVLKVWRALWKKMAAYGYCEKDRDPSGPIANLSPPPRQAVWQEGEAVRLVKQAWRMGYRGLAACLAVAWDSQLSPVDARSLEARQLRQDRVGVWFAVARAKTGRAALGTLGARATAILGAYLETMPAAPVGAAKLFRHRSGAPYTKDKLGQDFRTIREAVFGPQEARQLADFRRSGSVEALAGNVDPGTLSSKMANTLSQSNRLHHTYGPVVLASVRDADAARQRGRTKLREQNHTESVTAPASVTLQRRGNNPKPLK